MKFLAALALLAVTFVAQAGQDARAVKERIEASLLVSGTIHVDPQGRVERYEIDRRDVLPGHVNALLDRAIPDWRFEPTLHQGRPAHVETSMRIRVAATRQDEDAVALRIAGASFGGWDGDQAVAEEGGDVKPKVNQPPRYPRDAIRRGAMATVYLLGRVGLDGTMQEVVAEQVNLRYIAAERTMEDLREDFGKASVRAAMKWTFDVPADVDRSKGYWSVRVPVDFTINEFELPGYGEWDSYVPGPRQSAWWNEDDAEAGGDSYVSGGVYPVGTGLKLLTPLEGTLLEGNG